MTGHIVGLDPMSARIVVLRKGQDGKASRQVDVLTLAEANRLRMGIEDALYVANLRMDGKPEPDDVPAITPIPEPEQTAFDLDALNREEPTT